MEGGERDLKKRLKTTAAAMQGGWSRPEEDRRGDCGDLGDSRLVPARRGARRRLS